MDRGNFVSHWYEYDETKTKKYGLVSCKDTYIVYCIKNRNTTNESGLGFCRSQGGLIQMSRYKFIGDYNDNMGLVDLADTRSLYCNSTIIGPHW